MTKIVDLRFVLPLLALLLAACNGGGSFAAFNRGYEHYEEGDYDLAIEAFSTAVQEKPDYLTAYFYRGHAHLQQENIELAFADFSQVIELDPDYAEAYVYRGAIYAQHRDRRAAP